MILCVDYSMSLKRFQFLNRLIMELGNVERFLRESLEPIVYEAAIEEWITTWIDPLREQVQKLIDDAHSQLKAQSDQGQ